MHISAQLYYKNFMSPWGSVQICTLSETSTFKIEAYLCEKVGVYELNKQNSFV